MLVEDVVVATDAVVPGVEADAVPRAVAKASGSQQQQTYFSFFSSLRTCLPVQPFASMPIAATVAGKTRE